MSISTTIPIRTRSEANHGGHWRSRARRAKEQRTTTRLRVQTLSPELPPPLRVTLTRIAPRRLDDDNLQRALKAVRDGVADALGIDDRHEDLVAYRYAQERGGVREYAVRVEIEEVANANSK